MPAAVLSATVCEQVWELHTLSKCIFKGISAHSKGISKGISAHSEGAQIYCTTALHPTIQNIQTIRANVMPQTQCHAVDACRAVASKAQHSTAQHAMQHLAFEVLSVCSCSWLFSYPKSLHQLIYRPLLKVYGVCVTTR